MSIRPTPSDANYSITLRQRLPESAANLVDATQHGEVAGVPILSPTELRAVAKPIALALIAVNDVPGVVAALGAA
jgi:hypothetical protein